VLQHALQGPQGCSSKGWQEGLALQQRQQRHSQQRLVLQHALQRPQGCSSSSKGWQEGLALQQRQQHSSQQRLVLQHLLQHHHRQCAVLAGCTQLLTQFSAAAWQNLPSWP
jgi:hypothetical protein